MKGALIGFFIGLTLLIFFYFKTDIYKSKGTIDIHFHDTYFVLNYLSVIVFAILFLGTFFSVGGIIGNYFKSRLFWVLAVLFLSIDFYYIATFYKAFKDAEITQFPEKWI